MTSGCGSHQRAKNQGLEVNMRSRHYCILLISLEKNEDYSVTLSLTSYRTRLRVEKHLKNSDFMISEAQVFGRGLTY